MNKPIPVTLSLGSNLGDRKKNLEAAIELICDSCLQNATVSSFHNTKPIDCVPNTPDYLNAAIAGVTRLTPYELLANCQTIERFLGRSANHGRHTDRTIDIDILTYGDQAIRSKALTLPHPEMFRREFVLKPLSEILPKSVIEKYRLILLARN